METSPRGQQVREIFLETLTINPLFSIVDFKNRPFNWKYFAGELAWYMQGERTIDYINNFSNFWKGITNKDGTINSNYGNLLIGDQLMWAYKSLVKDKNSRQAISFVSKPEFQYEENKDFVCTVYLNFWIRNETLYMKVQMRSNDLFYGFSYDAPFFAALHQTMWHNLRESYPELSIGNYYHSADNIHYYERHFEIGDKILAENNMESPVFFFMKHPLFNINIEENKIEYTKEATEFKEAIDLIIVSGEITQENCKEALKKLYIIQ